MGKALIVDGGVATVGAGPVLTAVVAGSSSSFTVRNSQLANAVYLLDAWRDGGHAGYLTIVSPKLVPVSNGIRITTPAGTIGFNLGGPPFQVLTPQDVLAISDFGTAADVDAVCIQSYYTDLPGVSMTLKAPSDISGITDFVFGWEVAITSSATAGAQNTTVITTTIDSSTANRWYAVLGYTTDVELTAVGIQGVDTSASFIGGPGIPDAFKTRNYFEALSARTGLPCIPLFNAANKGNTFVVAIDQAASTAANVTLILAELSAGYQP